MTENSPSRPVDTEPCWACGLSLSVASTGCNNPDHPAENEHHA